MIDLSAQGIAKMCGPTRSGTYSATVTEVSTSTARGGAQTWHLTWKCDGVAAPVVEDLLVSVVGHPLAPALSRIADVLRENSKLLQFQHEGAIIAALRGCTATLTVTVDPLTHCIAVRAQEADQPLQAA